MTEVLKSLPDWKDQATTSKENLKRSLDDLWERYLDLLDQYQTSRNDLNKTLASGYISLAHANFSSPNRIYYGQNFYDERMQASIQASVNSEGKILIIDLGKSSTSPKASPAPQKAEPDSEHSAVGEGATAEVEPDITLPLKATSQDPLKWFGILTPPALRSAQDQFKHAISSAVPELANVSREMQGLEIEIRRTRKKILKSW